MQLLTDASSIEGQSEFISLSIVGMVGQTAYVGAYGEMKLKPEHTVVISGAAGYVLSFLAGCSMLNIPAPSALSSSRLPRRSLDARRSSVSLAERPSATGERFVLLVLDRT